MFEFDALELHILRDKVVYNQENHAQYLFKPTTKRTISESHESIDLPTVLRYNFHSVWKYVGDFIASWILRDLVS